MIFAVIGVLISFLNPISGIGYGLNTPHHGIGHNNGQEYQQNHQHQQTYHQPNYQQQTYYQPNYEAVAYTDGYQDGYFDAQDYKYREPEGLVLNISRHFGYDHLWHYTCCY